MTEFEVIPEIGLKNENLSLEFLLGMPIRQVLNGLQRVCRQIKGVELLYCQDDTLSQDIIVTLTNDGIRNIFDSYTQRLKQIEVFDLSRLSLFYCGKQFSSPNDQATEAKVEQCFGATHPGVYDAKQQVYNLNWRGLSFSFPTTSVVQANYAHGLSSLQFPDGAPSVVSRMTLIQGQTVAEARVPDIPQACYCGNVLLEELFLLRSKGKTIGLKLNLITEAVAADRLAETSLERMEANILFGDIAQEVLGWLGAPERVFYKSEDKMRIHRPSGDRQRLHSPRPNVDYFFNYFTLGLDVLFDAETDSVKKLVLHTNFPGHYDFGIYDRCNFKLSLDDEIESSGDFIKPPGNALKITPFTKWEDMSERFCDSESSQGNSQPVVLNRTSSNSSDNPFGSTFCYGYQDIIVEVMRNGHIAAVTLFDSDLLSSAALDITA